MTDPRPSFAPEPLFNRPDPANSDAPAEQPHGEMPRSLHAHVDETRVVAHMLKGLTGPGRTMIDVGAHHGMTASLFHDLGWTVYCFEPDPANRAHLAARFRNAERLLIDPRAVSDRAQQSAAFFTSEESTGISALHAFRDTHEETARVDVVTVADMVAERGLDAIDFLKIDVEGYDFAVLRGVPWDTHRPAVIECEFEDAKTVKLGHRTHDLAGFLEQKGYAVYVSEWHPIARYGVRHDWRGVYPYARRRPAPTAWGNLIAFSADPGFAAVEAAFRALIVTHTDETGAPPDTSRPAGPRPFYAAFGDGLRRRAPGAFAILQRARRAMARRFSRGK